MATKASPTTKKTNQRDVADVVTQKMIEALERGTVPWHKPWTTTGGFLPRSMSTDRTYRGINAVLLGLGTMENEYTSPYWGTYRQIEVLGGRVRRGEHGTEVVLYKPIEKETVNDNGEAVNERKGALLRSYNVFNATQCSGLPERYLTVVPDVRNEHERIAQCEEAVELYLVNGGPRLLHYGERAFYSPSLDLVTIPELAAFDSPEEYYSTIFHELTHSTGIESRLGREGLVEGHRFGDTLYSREELVAELGAAMACATLDIEQTATVENSAAYLAGWLEVLRGDKTLMLKAAAQSQRAVEYIGVTPERVRTPEREAALIAQSRALGEEPDTIPSRIIKEEVGMTTDNTDTKGALSIGALEAIEGDSGDSEQLADPYVPERDVMTDAELTLALSTTSPLQGGHALELDWDKFAEYGWIAHTSWGRDGHDFGDPPYQVFFTRHEIDEVTAPGEVEELWELMQYTEGDLTVWDFSSEADLYAAMDLMFATYLPERLRERVPSWKDAGQNGFELPLPLRGPNLRSRRDKARDLELAPEVEINAPGVVTGPWTRLPEGSEPRVLGPTLAELRAERTRRWSANADSSKYTGRELVARDLEIKRCALRSKLNCISDQLSPEYETTQRELACVDADYAVANGSVASPTRLGLLVLTSQRQHADDAKLLAEAQARVDDYEAGWFERLSNAPVPWHDEARDRYEPTEIILIAEARERWGITDPFDALGDLNDLAPEHQAAARRLQQHLEFLIRDDPELARDSQGIKR